MPVITVSDGIPDPISAFTAVLDDVFLGEEGAGIVGTPTATEVVIDIGDNTIATFTGVGFAFDEVGDIISGTVTGMLFEQFGGEGLGGETLTVTGLNLPLVDLGTAYFLEDTGADIGAVEALLLPLDWELYSNNTQDILPEDAVNIDGVTLNFTGNNIFDGQGGNDILWSGDGEDSVYGGKGHDSIFGGEGEDFLLGGKGDDTIYGGTQDDIIKGGQGANLYYGGDGNDKLIGGKDGEQILGGAGRDFLKGNDGNDDMFGGDQKDRLDGGDGADLLSGGNGKDRLIGGDGDDEFFGGAGSDVMTGGADADLFRFFDNTGHDTITDYNANEDELFLGGDLAIVSIVTTGGANEDVLVTHTGGTILLEDAAVFGLAIEDLNITFGGFE